MKKKNPLYLTGLAAAVALAFSACQSGAPDYAKNDPIYKDLDTTVKPGEDFFKYANGGCKAG